MGGVALRVGDQAVDETVGVLVIDEAGVVRAVVASTPECEQVDLHQPPEAIGKGDHARVVAVILIRLGGGASRRRATARARGRSLRIRPLAEVNPIGGRREMVAERIEVPEQLRGAEPTGSLSGSRLATSKAARRIRRPRRARARTPTRLLARRGSWTAPRPRARALLPVRLNVPPRPPTGCCRRRSETACTYGPLTVRSPVEASAPARR